MERLLEMIAAAAERLGFESVRIWPQMVMVTFVRSLAWLILDCIAVLVAIVGICLTVRWLRARHKEAAKRRKAREARADYYYDSSDDMFDVMFPGAFLVVPFVMIGILAVSFIPYYLSAVLYPEATTVMNLVQSVRP
jgi:hypothetical protein